MIPHHVYYQLAPLGLLWLCVILHYSLAKSRRVVTSTTGRTPTPQVPAPTRKRTHTLRGPYAETSLCRVCTRGEPSPRPCLHGDPSPCRRPTDARVPPTPRGISVLMRAVTIAAGWGGAISAPMDFLPFVKPNLSHFLPHLHDGLTTNPACIITRTMTQHGHQDTQESVANIA